MIRRQTTLKSAQKFPRSRAGFSLMEILIVLGIIGVIAAMAVPQLIGQQRSASIQTTKAAIANLEKALDLYAISNQANYPSNLESLLERGADMSAPLLDKIPVDAWGNPLAYEFPNQKANVDRPAIWSFGQNQKNDNGSGDDINNWDDLAQ